MQTSSKKPRFIKPPNKLKAKVGAGGIDETLLDRAQNFIKTVEIDFKPIALDFLSEIKVAMKKAREANDIETRTKAKEELARAIMQLKANGGMFKYQLISEIAALALYFLESVEELNEDSIQVIAVHEKAIQIIVANNMSGDGGQEGYALVKELEKACDRFYKKYPPKL